MPQPLSKVRPDATVTLSLSSLHDKPQMAIRVCDAIAMSARIDLDLSLLLVRVLGGDAIPAFAMYDALRSDNIKMDALKAAAKAALTPHQYRVFKAVIDVTDIAQKERNRLAHWIWGKCPELPNALLLANPKFLRAQDIERSRSIDFARVLASGVEPEDFMEKLFEFNKEEILVYTADDLLRACRDLADAVEALFFFTSFLRPIVRNKMAALASTEPQLTDLETSDGALRLLSGLRLFREALARVDSSKDQNSTPEQPT